MIARAASAGQAAAADAATIASGSAASALMARAGTAAAEIILRDCADRLHEGVVVLAGTGNNGGDAWVVAGVLSARDVRVQVLEVGEPRSIEARAARDHARAALPAYDPAGAFAPGIFVDGILGIGAAGAPRAEAARLVAMLAEARTRGATIVALDVPSGLDASTGAATGAVVAADLTITFGTVKRGLLLRRELAGRIALVDLALDPGPLDALPIVMDAGAVRAAVPTIAADAHKGTRGRLLIVGGDVGMAGATILAARGALRAGIGMVRIMVASESLSAVQSGEPAAMAATWASDGAAVTDAVAWADAVLLGPGLGRSADAARLMDAILASGMTPVVLDADALWPLSGRLDTLADIGRRRPIVLTPHAGEFARLTGTSVDEVSRTRFEAPAVAAQRSGATVLLKGVPTVISDGRATRISASGTPVLATGGSGDLLGGIIATLLAQGVPSLDAAAAGAWIHGRAAEIAGAGQVRGVTVHDVVAALPGAWKRTAARAAQDEGWSLPALPDASRAA